MNEKRSSSRWYPEENRKSEIIFVDGKEEVEIIDISTSGMKVSCSNPLKIGSEFYGTLKVHSDVGPFFVKGKVVRVERNGLGWATGLEFQKVRTAPFKELI